MSLIRVITPLAVLPLLPLPSLQSCIHQVASNFGDYARQHTQVVSHLFGLVCKDKPVQAHVSQPSPSGPLHLGMLVEDPRQAGFAVRIVSMYCGMLKWVAEQVRHDRVVWVLEENVKLWRLAGARGLPGH